jgi:hypothetical protein
MNRNIEIEVVYVDDGRYEDNNSNTHYCFSKTNNPWYVIKHFSVTELRTVAIVEIFLVFYVSFCKTSNTLLSRL